MTTTIIIKAFLTKYCTKVRKRESASYVELMTDDHKCIEFQGNQYYVPENNSFYTEDEELLKDMLLATFGL